ncbi:MAG: hypothetical protein SGI71_07115 [Verrucomicrobiota bacterium]|nr:hypothetical protein [Verrucomicrobiota bacterium]
MKVIKLKNGTVFQGKITIEDAQTIQVQTTDGKLVDIDRADLEK